MPLAFCILEKSYSMNAEKKRTAQTCLDAAHEGTKSFPEIVGILIEAGFEGYTVDYRRNSSTYYLPNGDSVELNMHATDGEIAVALNIDGIKAAIKEAQNNAADYSYEKFCEKVKINGCAGYYVSFLGKRALYFGRTAETHVEYFPQ